MVYGGKLFKFIHIHTKDENEMRIVVAVGIEFKER